MYRTYIRMYVHTVHTVHVVGSSFPQIINDGASLTEIGMYTHLLNSSSHVVTYVRTYVLLLNITMQSYKHTQVCS